MLCRIVETHKKLFTSYDPRSAHTRPVTRSRMMDKLFSYKLPYFSSVTVEKNASAFLMLASGIKKCR